MPNFTAVQSPTTHIAFEKLASRLEGEVSTDRATRILYATDASVYRVLPAAVAFPKSDADVAAIAAFAAEHHIPITARTAGTSLSGQAVGEGLVVDFSVHFGSIIEINPEEKWVRVQPGVIRDDLNRALAQYGLFFGPNTSTANRCMMGGMVGNNSSGTTSIRYGVTRDKVIEISAVLGDGSTAVFREVSHEDGRARASESTLEGRIYAGITELFSRPGAGEQIRAGFPKSEIHRRNTGYALDVIADMRPFNPDGPPLNLAKLLAGSEGTLCMTTSMKLKVDDLPPPHEAVICAHFIDVGESMRATVEIMKLHPYACELMDKTILDCTAGNPEQAENRFFVEGDPGAIIAVELRGETAEACAAEVDRCIELLKSKGFGYAFPVISPPDTARVWSLRAAGLGVLSNVKGDAKPVAFVEDTAVALADLPRYIAEFEALMETFGQRAVYYAHAGAGELHLRPVLNLKTAAGQRDFRAIGTASAKLVAAYGGSLSGEHGDGRARSEFIADVIGRENYELLREVKKLWDPAGIFNPGNITDPVPMDADLRYSAGQPPFAHETFLDFSGKGNMLAAAEACNGSGDCRKPIAAGGTMCPSYRATRDEKDSTRGRANVLREVLTRPENPAYPLGSDAAHDVLKLCLSCKACARECPSSVDMSKLKAEADYQYQRRNGFSLRTRFFGHFHRSAPLASAIAPLSNFMLTNNLLSAPIKKSLNIAASRSLPRFAFRTGLSRAKAFAEKGPAELVLYIDEFTMYQDAGIAAAAAEFLARAGIRFIPVYAPSGRPYMSKGMLPGAKATAEKALKILGPHAEAGLPIVGLEPSAITGFRDDLPSLFSGKEKTAYEAFGASCRTFEEYIAIAADAGRITPDIFTDRSAEIRLHLHCHQKALSHVKHSKQALSLPSGYRVTVIPSGCCGMAGSFGYEAEHYDLSMKIGESVLFPRVREAAETDIVVAAGTSCRHQIADGTGRSSIHPAEVLRDALK